jgi:WD40 repeat protein/DNA-binding SARP family transcriptional activator/tRNA A-37 threonylcarbamoyl transferase component Bud32
MSGLELSLFGQFQARLDGEFLEGFRTAKVQALLVYLAVEETPQRREALMTLFWPGMPEKSARQNLRQILYYLRRDMTDLSSKGDGEQTVPLLLANRRTIQLNPQADVSIDVQRFESLMETTQYHGHPDILLCQECRENLEKALSLYLGDFLADFYLDDSNEFEEWAEVYRQRYRRQVLDALETLTSTATREGSYAEARVYAERQLELDDLRESAYRQLMKILALNGQRAEAMALYESFRRLLAEELGMAPASRTTERYEQIRAGDMSFTEPAARGVRGLELKEKIGEGTYGAVHRAVQPAVGREVAVKVIRRKYVNDPEFIRRFEAEAQMIARLEHPYIVPLYDYWRDSQGAYLVMRLLRGGSLLTALESGPWDIEPTLKLMDQISTALAAAHCQGVVHRDIKPANILLDEAGNAYLSDFGIAKDLVRGLQLKAGGPIIMDTPDYVSPEQLRNETVGPPCDIYSLGAVLYEILTGERPFPEGSVAMLIQKQMEEPIPPVSASRPDLPREIDTIIQRATAKHPGERYDNALTMAEAFRQAAHGVEPILIDAGAAAVVEVTNPYKGLRAFQEIDADDFYGREALVQVLASRLCETRFLAVVGPSGSGKSSLVKAGLLPALRRGALPGSENWFITEMVPGSHPLEELELALLPIAVDPPPSLIEPLQKDERGLLRTLRRILPGDGETQLLLVIDQFEELFTLIEDDEQRLYFLSSLFAALNDPHSPLHVVVTLRADFYDRPLQIQPLGELFKQHTEVVLPLNREELLWAIREPARHMGVGVEESVITAMVADVVDQPGALPLLQYTLTELFDDRQDGTMTLAAYKALGGVSGALAQRAEDIYSGLNETGQEATRQLFLRLVTLGEGVEDTRRRVLRSELEGINDQLPVNGQLPTINSQLSIVNEEQSADANPTSNIRRPTSQISSIIDSFGAARLLTFDRDPVTRGPVVEIAHEALLKEWPRLRGWLEENRDDVRLQRILATETAEWQEHDQDDGYLLRGARLDQYKAWAEESAILLTGEEQAFLAASFAAREVRLAEEEARQRRELETAQQLAQTERQRAEEQTEAAGSLRRRALILAGALGIAAILAIAALFFAQQSTQNALIAATREAEAASEAEHRATAQALAEEQADVASSRELAATALNQLGVDAERSILLALYALSKAQTLEAENALHQAIQSSRVLQTLRGHGEPFFFMDYSPDGSKLATTGGNVAKIWDMETGEELLTLEGHEGEAFGISFSPDGKRLATASHDGKVIVWDAQNGARLLTLGEEGVPFTAVQFSPDGSQLAANEAYDGHIRIWDAETGEQLVSFLAHEAPMWFVTYDPDGKRLATAGVDGTAKVWDANSYEELLTLGGHEDIVSRVNFSPDGERLVTSSMKVRLWDAASGAKQMVLDGHHGFVLWAAFSPEGDRIATSGVDGQVIVWDAISGEELFTLSGHAGLVLGVAFSPDGERLASASYDGSARIWDLRPERELLTIDDHEKDVYSVAFNPQGTRLISGSIDGTARLWDIADPAAENFGRQLIAVGEGDPANGVRALAYSPDGRRFIASNAAGKATVYDGETGQELFTLHGHAPGLSGETVYNGVTGVAFSPDGELIATASDDLTAKIWDAANGRELFTLEGHVSGTTTSPPHEGVVKVAFHPAGPFVATAGADGTVKIWSTDDGRLLFDVLAHPDSAVIDLAFNFDGSRLATGAFDGTTKVWRVSDDPQGISLEELYTLIGHTSGVYGVAFTPDGSRLVTAGEDGTAKVWDAASGQELLTLTAQPLGLLDLAITPDGKYVATAGRDGMVRLFVLDTEELIRLGKSRVTRTLTEEECQRYLHMETCPETA